MVEIPPLNMGNNSIKYLNIFLLSIYFKYTIQKGIKNRKNFLIAEVIWKLGPLFIYSYKEYFVLTAHSTNIIGYK